jgi:excinuclease ABC subunit C
MMTADDINLKEISEFPGVYLFIGPGGRILYVGKAKNLRARLSTYFNSAVKTVKTEKMLSAAKSVRTIIVSNETEAFLLEMNLIKTEQPKYNVLLKDSKAYPYVKLTKEEFPRLIYTRNTKDADASYFGPFVNAGELKQTIEFLREAFPLRTCSDTQLKKKKICLKYQIHRCQAPCEGFISQERYMDMTEEIRRFFDGNIGDMKKKLEETMFAASEELRFEDAAFYRDRLTALKTLFAKQNVVDIDETRSLDLFYRYESPSTIGVTQLFVRGGRLLSAKSHFFSPDEDNLLERFIVQFYSNIRQFPDMIAAEGEDVSEELTAGLSALAGKKIILRKKGFGELMRIAKKNAVLAAREYALKQTVSAEVSPRLNRLAGREVVRCECVDISHLGGENTVGVSVVSEEGEFLKKDYKKYRIKTAANNDVQAITELFERKTANIADGSETAADLYLIDGGISQLNAACAVLKKTLPEAAVLSISKSRSLRFMKNDLEDSIELIHIPNRKNPHKFRKNDPVLLFLQKLRDEAHRFAITYSRALSLKKSRVSPLLEVDGIGESRAKKILLSIPDLYSRDDLSPELIRCLSKLPLQLAEAVYEKVRDKKRDSP